MEKFCFLVLKKNADLAFFTFEWKSETYVCAEFN